MPVASRTSVRILELAVEGARSLLDESHPSVAELESIVTALTHLPPRTETDPARVRERRREKEVVRRRLSNLVKESNEARAAIHDAVHHFNGEAARPESFDVLEELIGEQAYRLSFWRVAADEINYRRLFDVREFVAAILDAQGSEDFVKDLSEFVRVPTRAGMLNSLSQTLLKIASPGVPDFYQGTEVWSFTLVDPDNRRQVDYDERRALLASLRDAGACDATEFVKGLLEKPDDGRALRRASDRRA